MLGLGTSINKSSSSESASIAARSSSFTGLLDESYGGSASAAYSVRRLSSSYSGKALQIRRVSDNVEVDVSFDNNNEISLDSAVTNVTEETTGSSTSIITRAVNLGEFVANASYTDADSLGSTDSAKVQCWYDQSGSSNDTTQNTAGSQPTIVSSGALVTGSISGKPTMFFDTTHQLPTTATASNATLSLFAVAQGNTGRKTILKLTNANTFDLRTWNNRNYKLFYGDGTTQESILTSDTSKNETLYSVTKISGSVNTYLDSNSDGSASTSLDGTGTIAISENGQLGGTVNISEIIIYESDQSDNRTNIENNINAFYSIF